MAVPAKSIDEVLAELDRIIDSSVAENNFLGIFAYVYRRTTAQVRQAILDKKFEDSARMELMDVTFANLYLTAYQRYTNAMSCSASWEMAFGAANEKITIIQHILLGMNAHINMDLGIAAASIAPGAALPALKNDFMKVNQVLNDLVNEMQDRLSKVSPLMFILDWIGKNTDDVIINFSMAKAREQAWNLASVLSGLPDPGRNSVIDITDHAISDLGNLVKNPPGKILKTTLNIISFFEEKNVKTIIDKLRQDTV